MTSSRKIQITTWDVPGSQVRVLIAGKKEFITYREWIESEVKAFNHVTPEREAGLREKGNMVALFAYKPEGLRDTSHAYKKVH